MWMCGEAGFQEELLELLAGEGNLETYTLRTPTPPLLSMQVPVSEERPALRKVSAPMELKQFNRGSFETDEGSLHLKTIHSGLADATAQKPSMPSHGEPKRVLQLHHRWQIFGPCLL